MFGGDEPVGSAGDLNLVGVVEILFYPVTRFDIGQPAREPWRGG